MSKQELKNLQNQLSDKMNREGVTVDFYHHHETLKPTLDEIQRARAKAIEKSQPMKKTMNG